MKNGENWKILGALLIYLRIVKFLREVFTQKLFTMLPMPLLTVFLEQRSALGFISAIGAIGGFFIPKAFGISLDLTGSPAGAMKVFLVFYIACVVITWLVYGRKQKS